MFRVRELLVRQRTQAISALPAAARAALTALIAALDAELRIPTKPAMHSNLKPATCSDLKPAGVPI